MNNGNISAIANGMDSTHGRDQSFFYDYLNRISQDGDNSHWGEQYGYDAWGNMISKTLTKGAGTSFAFPSATVQNRLPNLAYDPGGSGAVVTDQFGNSYAYDAEGRVVSAGAASNLYDGDGNRVAETSGGTTTLYWPSSVAGVVDESNAAASSFGTQVYLGSLQVWSEDTSGNGRFLFQDQVGSVRVTASAGGTLLDDIDYRSFGDVVANHGQNPSDNHYVFTSYISDPTSNTDFANYRNLSTSMSRFSSPDPYGGSYDSTNPQSFNRYAYVMNQPTTLVDPSGLRWEASAVCSLCSNFWNWLLGLFDDSDYGGYDAGGFGFGSSGSGPVGVVYGGGGHSGGSGGGTGMAPNNGPTPNPCQAKLLNMANQQLGTNFNSSNVTGSYMNGTAYNIIIQSNQLTAAQFNNIQQGRYTTSGWQYLTGVGLAGHIADETNLGFAQSAFQSSNIGGNLSVSFAFHDDHGYANNPIGALIHWITDVLGHNTRKPC